jgi:hypothetical protein
MSSPTAAPLAGAALEAGQTGSYCLTHPLANGSGSQLAAGATFLLSTGDEERAAVILLVLLGSEDADVGHLEQAGTR